MKQPRIPYLETSVINLLPLMKHPSVKLRVLVVDSYENAARGIEEILRAWPNIIMRSFVPSENVSPVEGISTDDNIVLFSDWPKEISDSDMALLDSMGFFGLAASIVDGENPAWTAYHFGKKREVLVSMEVATDFVIWMNCLIEKIGNAR